MVHWPPRNTWASHQLDSSILIRLFSVYLVSYCTVPNLYPYALHLFMWQYVLSYSCYMQTLIMYKSVPWFMFIHNFLKTHLHYYQHFTVANITLNGLSWPTFLLQYGMHMLQSKTRRFISLVEAAQIMIHMIRRMCMM